VGGARCTHGSGEKSVRVKARRKEPLGRPRCRWKDEIRLDVGETPWAGGAGVDLIGLG
jgi:hypothetical protein